MIYTHTHIYIIHTPNLCMLNWRIGRWTSHVPLWGAEVLILLGFSYTVHYGKQMGKDGRTSSRSTKYRWCSSLGTGPYLVEKTHTELLGMGWPWIWWVFSCIVSAAIGAFGMYWWYTRAKEEKDEYVRQLFQRTFSPPPLAPDEPTSMTPTRRPNLGDAFLDSPDSPWEMTSPLGNHTRFIYPRRSRASIRERLQGGAY